jgi:hypothetical protein
MIGLQGRRSNCASAYQTPEHEEAANKTVVETIGQHPESQNLTADLLLNLQRLDAADEPLNELGDKPDFLEMGCSRQ